MLHLDSKDVALKLFETFREVIREAIEETPSNHSISPETIYWCVNIPDKVTENHLYNCVDTFKFINEDFHKELKEEILNYIEGEIEA